MSEHALELVDLHAGYLGGVPIVNGVTHHLPPGSVTTVVGPNGAGKSTLLKAVYGLTRWSRGTVRVSGREVSGLAPHRRLEAGVSLVPQGRCNFPQLTVLENLQLAVYTLPKGRRAAAVDGVLARFPVLGEHRRRHAGHLSGGQQQILETAMALTVEPRVLLIDEPSLGLSPKARAHVFETLTGIARDGVTVLMVEQNVVEGLEASDHALVMVEGRVDRHGPAAEVLADPDMKAVFLGGRPDQDLPSTPQPLQERS
jgi:branched-chain amino acid transport system ATP-binding protein